MPCVERLTPKGIAVFHVPFRTTGSSARAALRWMRRALPGINGVANVVRGRPVGEPFVPTYSYDLADVFDVLRGRGIQTMHVVFEPHEGVETALLYLERPAAPRRPGSSRRRRWRRSTSPSSSSRRRSTT